MRIFVRLLALLVSTQAFPQDASKPAVDGPVSFAELEGSVIEATVIRHQVMRKLGHEFPIRFHSIMKITIGLGDKLDVTWTSISDTPRGVFHGKTLSASLTLNQAKENSPRNLGGGDGVWIFNDGTLTQLRTYKTAGAFKRDFSFTRTAGGFACTANEAFAREEGSGPLVMNSAVDDVPVTVISWKQISSSCRVLKPDHVPTAQSGDVK